LGFDETFAFFSLAFLMKSRIFFFSSDFPSSVSSAVAASSVFAAVADVLSFLLFLIENSPTLPLPDPPCSAPES